MSAPDLDINVIIQGAQQQNESLETTCRNESLDTTCKNESLETTCRNESLETTCRNESLETTCRNTFNNFAHSRFHAQLYPSFFLFQISPLNDENSFQVQGVPGNMIVSE